MFKRLRSKKAQSTLEYIILVAVIILVLTIFLPGIFQTHLTQTYTYGTNGMLDMANRLRNSRPASNAQ